MIILAMVLTFTIGPIEHKSYLWRYGFRDSEACKTAANLQVVYASSRLPKEFEVSASYSCEKSEVHGI